MVVVVVVVAAAAAAVVVSFTCLAILQILYHTLHKHGNSLFLFYLFLFAFCLCNKRTYTQKISPPKVQFKYIVPLVYAPILPLVRIAFRKQPRVRNIAFGEWWLEENPKKKKLQVLNQQRIHMKSTHARKEEPEFTHTHTHTHTLSLSLSLSLSLTHTKHTKG